MRIPGGVPSAHVDTFARSLLPAPALWPVFDYSGAHLRDYPDRINVSVALLDAAVANGHADKVMTHYEGRAWTYGELLGRVERIARVLLEDLGVVPGQCVLLRSANSPMLAACWLAVVRIGAIAVASSPMLREQELGFVADKLHIRLALCDVSVAEQVKAVGASSQWLSCISCFTDMGESSEQDADLDRLLAGKPTGAGWADTAADDIAAIVFTSGTTGNPKAVAHFHRDLLAACDCWRHPLPIAPGEVMCATSTMGFTYGLTSSLLYPLRFRAASVLLPRPTAESLLAAVEAHRVTALCTVPTFLRKLLPHMGASGVASLRKCFSSGEPLGDELWRAWRDMTGTAIIEGFGSSELLTRVLSPSASGEPAGSLGKAVPGYTACLLDDSGRLMPAGGRGFLAIRGPTGCRYLGDDERQKAFVINGWNVTADVFEQDDDGCFWYVGRKDDIIVSSGYNIAAVEVERVIADHPWVIECSVVGVPDPVRGKIVRACVVLRQGVEASDATALSIQEHVKSVIAPYKYPRDVKFMDQLPRTSSGKVKRYRLQNP